MPTRREMRKNNFLNIYNGIYEVVNITTESVFCLKLPAQVIN